MFPQEPIAFSFQSFLNVCQLSESKTIQNVHIRWINREDVELFQFFDSFGVILEFLKPNAATFSSNNVLHSFRFDCVRSYNESSRILYKNCIKTSKTLNFSTFLSQFEAFSITNCFYLSAKGH